MAHPRPAGSCLSATLPSTLSLGSQEVGRDRGAAGASSTGPPALDTRRDRRRRGHGVGFRRLAAHRTEPSVHDPAPARSGRWHVPFAPLALWAWRADRPTTGAGTVLAETGVVAGVVLLLMQVVPFGRMPSNPPVTGEPKWDSPQTRTLAVRACFDCHSNETEHPWYSKVAPISWALSDHVESGRSKLNFSLSSTSHRPTPTSPPGSPRRVGCRPATTPALVSTQPRKLSNAEVAILVAGLRATPGLSDH